MSELKLEEIAKTMQFSSEQTNYIAIRFLELKGNQYYLNLTNEDAVRLGISKIEFVRMQQEITNVNLSINSWIADAVDFVLNNPDSIMITNIEITNELYRLKLGSESDIRTRVFSSNDQNWTTDSFFAPSDAKSVSITCSGGGLLTGYNVYARTCGVTNSANGVGYLGSWSTSINLTCSNTQCTIGFKTTNSNGGTCRYSW